MWGFLQEKENREADRQYKDGIYMMKYNELCIRRMDEWHCYLLQEIKRSGLWTP